MGLYRFKPLPSGRMGILWTLATINNAALVEFGCMGHMSFGCSELSLPKGNCWCDCPSMGSEDIPYFSENEWIKVVQGHKKGYLMASGEALEWMGLNRDMQISNPSTKWHLHPYEPPMVGFRGAVHLVNLWINETVED